MERIKNIGVEMKEYTILTSISVVIVIALDFYLKTGLLKKRLFWLFHIFVALMNLLTNGYLTGRPIVLYGEEFYLGIRITTIPIEDFFYGFSLITLNIILFEYYQNKSQRTSV